MENHPCTLNTSYGKEMASVGEIGCVYLPIDAALMCTQLVTILVVSQ